MSAVGGGGSSTFPLDLVSCSSSSSSGANIMQHDDSCESLRRTFRPALFFSEKEVGVPNTVHLEPMTEDALVINLHQRFKRDFIYTEAGDILISINPYKKLALYSLDVVEIYRNRSLLAQLPPHIFGFADRAHHNLREKNEDQCIVVSGESGSGKTEAARIVLQYVTVTAQNISFPINNLSTSIQSSNDFPVGGFRVVRDRLLQTGPLLEAFGNAKTQNNDNSSRFAKYLEVEFDFKGDPLGGTFTTYLLEKSRVTQLSCGERNFHIFYQIITGADIQLLKTLKLHRNVDNYTLLRTYRPLSLESIDDKKDFQVTKKALDTLGISNEEIIDIFKIIASILKLGNIGFTPASNIDGSEGSTVTDDYELFEVSLLLGIDPKELHSALTQRTILVHSVLQSPQTDSSIGTRGKCCLNSSTTNTPTQLVPSSSRPSLTSSKSKEVLMDSCTSRALHSSLATKCSLQLQEITGSELYVTDLSANEASYTRDSLCRALYARLFSWLVKKINSVTKFKKYGKRKVLGIMDIFGFEVLEKNAFEQFIINCCNETLHQTICEYTLKLEQEEYIREGLKWSYIDYFNNSPICDLIEKNNSSILSILDDECNRMACTSDEIFFNRVLQTCSENDYFESTSNSPRSQNCPSRIPSQCFRLRHYAGTVTYNVIGFVEKSCDTFPPELSQVMFSCTHPILKTLFPEGNPKRTTLKRAATVTAHCKMSLAALIRNLHRKTPHFIRCIKPNELKQPGIFEVALVKHQVCCLQLIDRMKVVKAGFAYRETYDKFVRRFKMLSTHTWPAWKGSSMEGASSILRELPICPNDITFGRTKLFIKYADTVAQIEELRRHRIVDLATLVQKTWKGWSCKRRYQKMQHSQIIIAAAWRSWRAKEEYRELKRRKQIEWAVLIIQRQWLQWKRRQFLLRLSCCLPTESPINKDWPLCSNRFADTSFLLRKIHHKWRCHRYRLKFDQTSRNRMREKVTASIIFKDRKTSYPRSVSHPFLGDYVRLRQNVQWKKTSVETNDQYVVFADIINKITRSSGKFAPILLVISTSSMLILDQRTLQIKYRVPAEEIYRLSLSPFLDDIAIFHVRAGCEFNGDSELCGNCKGGSSFSSIPSQTESETTGCLFQSEFGRKKGDFVFQTGHVIEIVTKLFLVIQNAVGKPPEVNINTEFEANFSGQTVLISFKCMSLPEGQIRIFRKGSRMEILL